MREQQQDLKGKLHQDERVNPSPVGLRGNRGGGGQVLCRFQGHSLAWGYFYKLLHKKLSSFLYTAFSLKSGSFEAMPNLSKFMLWILRITLDTILIKTLMSQSSRAKHITFQRGLEQVFAELYGK